MKVLVVDNQTNYLNDLLSWLKPHQITVVNFQQLSEIKPQNFDFIVLSGSHKNAVIPYKNEYASEIDLIKNSNIPILGICLGFELIAYAYGSTLERLDEKQKGIIELSLKQDPLTVDLNKINVFESHRWIVKKLSKELIILAASENSLEIIKHQKKPIYGLQFHPEVIIDQQNSSKLLNNFVNNVVKT